MTASKRHSEPTLFERVRWALQEAYQYHDAFGALDGIEEQFEALHRAARALLESADDQTHPDDGFPIEEWLNLVDAVRGSNPASSHPTLDDRNPASVVGVPWNERGYAGDESSPASGSGS